MPKDTKPVWKLIPIQGNLLVPRWDVHPSTRRKLSSSTGLDVLLENVARADAVLARYLDVHSTCELPIVEQ
jgi:hypothetical protein